MSQPDFDEFLDRLSEIIKPIAESLDTSENTALLTIGVVYSNEPGKEGVQTFTAATGYLGIIAEGLYAELADQLEDGNAELFMILRRVIRDLEEDFGITEDVSSDGNSLH